MEEEFDPFSEYWERRNMNGKTSKVFESKVSTLFKFYNSLSTYTSRPELIFPSVLSTDFGWGSLTRAQLWAHNPYQCGNNFDFFYSQIYEEGKSFPSLNVGELCGSLHDDTIKSWISPENEMKVFSFDRFVFHKPLKPREYGGSVRNREVWDFENHTVVIEPSEGYSEKIPGCFFPSFKAKYDVEKGLCQITLEQYHRKTYFHEIEYFEKTVIPKLFEWMSDDYKPMLPKLRRQRARPLTYISNARYWTFHDSLKMNHAPYVKDVWRESTDPVKFIHEDIGIASYIATVIEESKESKFRPPYESVDILDLGCGNGLLCYFLHKLSGNFYVNSTVTGFDIRPRKIWADLLGAYVPPQMDTESVSFQQEESSSYRFTKPQRFFDLRERTIIPNKIDDLIHRFGLAPNGRSKGGLWIIGNHSDELTPWIPVIARRLNATGFFIIPCCPFDFFKKYQRSTHFPGNTTYQSYMEYMCAIGDIFGYKPTLENLRIPSTKKICLVGVDCSRNFKPAVLDERVQKLMTQLNKADKDSNLANFIPRQRDTSKESPNIKREVAKPIIDKIFNLLTKDFGMTPRVEWYAGRVDVTFNDLLSVLSLEDRDVLKGKGNGLKTLVKSNRHLFSIDNNIVKLRIPNSKDIENVSESSRDKIQTKPCFLHCHHPQGCPLSAELCAFKHEPL